MTGEPDIIGRDGPQRTVPAWLRAAVLVLAMGVGAVVFVATRGDEEAAPAPLRPVRIDSLGGEPDSDCGEANLDGLAWGPPLAAVQPDGRLVAWRIWLCNRRDQAVTVESVRPLSRGERRLPAETVQALSRDGIATDSGTARMLPVEIPAGQQVEVGTVSVVLGCDRSGAASGLTASVRIGGSSKGVDMPMRLPGMSPAEMWCNELPPGGGQSALPLLRDGAVRVEARGSDIDVDVPLFNPNRWPVSLTGVHSPSPGVSVARATDVTLGPGGRAPVSVRLFIESCTSVSVDAPWQLTFTGRTDHTAVYVAPVRLGADGWQAEVVRRVCPAARPLPESTGRPELKVTGPIFRADRDVLQVTQIVRNVGSRELVLRVHARSAPGMAYIRAAVLPEAAAHAAIGTTTGGRLRTWSMSPGRSAFLTYFYRLGADTESKCLAPPTDRWRAPADATDLAGRPVNVGDDVTQPAPGRRVWLGGWLVDATPSCVRPVPPERAAPFVILAGQPQLVRGGKDVKYPLTIYPLPGEELAVVTGVRLVGAYADLPMSTTSGTGEISPVRRSGPAVGIPIRCPAPGVPIIVAVSYRTGSGAIPLPVLVDLTAPPVDPTARC